MKKLLPKSVRNPQGFTLIELLVVISIIAILAVIGIAIFSGAQARARNAKRREDISAIAKALEVNRSPVSIAYTSLSPTWFGGGAYPLVPAGDVPQYCLVYVSNLPGYVLTPPNLTGWPVTQACSNTSGAGAPTTNPPLGSIIAAVTVTGAGTIPAAGIVYSFEICTMLESETIGVGTRLPYCINSSQ